MLTGADRLIDQFVITGQLIDYNKELYGSSRILSLKCSSVTSMCLSPARRKVSIDLNKFNLNILYVVRNCPPLPDGSRIAWPQHSV